jgi:hypothetical protein
VTIGRVLITAAGIAVALSVVMTVAWFAWRSTRNSGWVDATWTFGLGAVGCIGALAPLSGPMTARQILVAALIVLWSLRLGLHIAQRTARISDDPRYAKLQREWGIDAPRQMFRLLQKQALVSIPLALSVVLAAWNPVPGLRVQDALAALVLLIAPARASRMRSFAAFAPIPAIGTASATSASGAGRGIRITSSSGSGGWPMCCSRSTSVGSTRGVSSPSPGLCACIGCWCTFPASRH